MPFFKKKSRDPSQLPEFPEFPKEIVPQFPPYAPKDFSPKEFPSLKEIKNAVRPKLEEPKEFPRLESMPKLTETITYEPREDSARFAPLKLEHPMEVPVRKKPIAAKLTQPAPKLISTAKSFPMVESPYQNYEPRREGKPLYVQIEEYKKIIETVNNIKYSIEEADRILNNLRQIKDKENEELSRWTAHLANLKEKLLTIDKRLSEV